MDNSAVLSKSTWVSREVKSRLAFWHSRNLLASPCIKSMMFSYRKYAHVCVSTSPHVQEEGNLPLIEDSFLSSGRRKFLAEEIEKVEWLTEGNRLKLMYSPLVRAAWDHLLWEIGYIFLGHFPNSICPNLKRKNVYLD